MESDNARLDLVWLDEAFAKSYMDDEFEATCCLAGISKDNVRTDKSFLYYKKPSQILNPIVKKLYEIIPTWIIVLERKNSLLWFIEKAVINDTPHVNYDLLLPKCFETKYRRNECIEKHPDIIEFACETGLGQIEKYPELVEFAKKVGWLQKVNAGIAPDNNNDGSSEEEVEYPKDRNSRLLKSGIRLLGEYKPPYPEGVLKEIHAKIIEEEANNSKVVSEATLKHVVKLDSLKFELKKQKQQSEKVI